MRARTLMLLAVALVLAVGTAMLARSWLASQRAQEMARAAPMALPQSTKSVLVARADVQRGQILRAEDLVWQVWPEGTLDKGYIVSGGPQKPESFAGWVAKNTIAGGEPISAAKIIAPGDRGFLAAVLHPGMRAVSVPVTVTSGISGFIFPGDQVDLLLTYPIPTASAQGGDKASNYEHKAAETVLRNIRVVAIDQRLASKAGEAVVAHTATFEVTPKQSEVIAVASEIGKVSLTLRSLVPGKDEVETDKVVDAGAGLGVNVQKVSVNGGKSESDSPIADGATFTLDSEISPLLPKAAGSKGTEVAPQLSICRGGGKTCDPVAGISLKASEEAPAKQGTSDKGS